MTIEPARTTVAPSPPLTAPPLASWNDGPAKQAILRFVGDVTAGGAVTYVAPEDRIAVFDNDGTLWPEQPVPVQFAFALDRIQATAGQHPEWQEQEPFRSILAGDLATAVAGGEKALAELLVATHTGMTTDEFAEIVRQWIATARHPRFDRPHTDLFYRPMLELLGYLRDNGFRTFIVSAGGIDFMRVWSQAACGIPPEQVIGSQGKVAFEVRSGEPVLVKLPQIELVEIGALDKALGEAQQMGWTVVDMKRDWNRVYAFE